MTYSWTVPTGFGVVVEGVLHYLARDTSLEVMPEPLVAVHEAPHVGEAQGVGLVIFGRFAVFHIRLHEGQGLGPRKLSQTLVASEATASRQTR